MAAMAVASAVATASIDPGDIDHRAAHGLSERAAKPGSDFDPHHLDAAVDPRPDPDFSSFGNAAMLPLLGQAMVARGAGDPSAFTGATVVDRSAHDDFLLR